MELHVLRTVLLQSSYILDRQQGRFLSASVCVANNNDKRDDIYNWGYPIPSLKILTPNDNFNLSFGIFNRDNECLLGPAHNFQFTALVNGAIVNNTEGTDMLYFRRFTLEERYSSAQTSWSHFASIHGRFLTHDTITCVNTFSICSLEL